MSNTKYFCKECYAELQGSGCLSIASLGEDEKRIAVLEAKLTACEKDATRYKWLRNEDNWGDDEDNRWQMLGESSHSEFDAIIDAAITREKSHES